MIQEEKGNYIDLIDDDFDYVEQTSNTYAIDYENNRIVGYVDGIEAVKQAIYLILQTEKYEYLIYDEYGSELWHLFGQNDAIEITELERCIKEALLQDTRIIAIHNFKIERNGNKRICSFDVESIFGDIDIKREVAI